jgi:hypothetical protein
MKIKNKEKDKYKDVDKAEIQKMIDCIKKKGKDCK